MQALNRVGFVLHRVSGNHHVLRHVGPPSPNVTIPVHGSRSLKRATLRAIIKQAGLSVEEFVGLL
jgi:predicted RNA binding protein YcfA (HicA-like mRNA interferase family)